MRKSKPRRVWLKAGLLLIAGLGFLCADVFGDSFVRPRLVEYFDFEEADEGNFESMPRYWFAIGREPNTSDTHFLVQPIHAEQVGRHGFSRHSEVRFDRPQSERGEHKLYLGLNGGSSGVFLQKGAIPALADSDYQITFKVKTSKLEHARLLVKVYFIDSRGNRIEGSVRETEYFETGGEWLTQTLELHGTDSGAAWIGMQVELLQPEQQRGLKLGVNDVMYVESDGGAWIDDVAVWQLPHVSISSGSEVNILRGVDRPRLTFEVRDLSARPMVAEVTIYDHDRQVVLRDNRVIGGGRPLHWRWDLELPQYGWYLVDLLVREGEPGFIKNKPIARAISSFLWMDANSYTSSVDRQRFGLDATGCSDLELVQLPQLVTTTGLGMAVVSCWDDDTTFSTVLERQKLLDKLMPQLLNIDAQLSLSLSPLPIELAYNLRLDRNEALSIFAGDRSDWNDYLTPFLMRYGLNVRHWRLGDADQTSLLSGDELIDQVSTTAEHFRMLTARPVVMLPWRGGYLRREGMPVDLGYDLEIGTSLSPEYLPEYLSEWSDAWFFDISIDTLSAKLYGHSYRISDLVRRMVYSWQFPVESLSISKPWAVSGRGGDVLLPDPLLGAYSTAASMLSDREYMGELDLADGIVCQVFDGARGGLMVLWNDSADLEEQALRLYLGKNVEVVDVWGNRQSLAMVGGKHELLLTGMPIFVEGIDSQVAAVRSGFSIDDPFVESLVKNHPRKIKLQNPWSRAISGTVRFVGPKGWAINPGWSRFSMPANGQIEIPVKMSFKLSEVAGPKRLVAEVELDGGLAPLFEASAPMMLGLEGVGFNAMLSIEENAKSGASDALVTQLISNNGNENLTMYAFANIDGYPRQQRIISNLEPGQSIVRRFRFTDAGDSTVGRRVRAGLRQTGGPAVLNVLLNE